MNGACSGNPNALNLEVRTSRLAVTLTSNGGPVMQTCAASSAWSSMVFATDAGDSWNQVQCGSPLRFSVNGVDGTTVTPSFSGANGYDSTPSISLPDWFTFTPITLAGPTNRVLDVPATRVTGTVRANGALPPCSSPQNRFATVLFISTNPLRPVSFRSIVSCASGSPRYDVWLPHDTYRVIVDGVFYADVPVVVSNSVTVTPATSVLNFDAITFDAALRFTINGNTPTDQCAGQPSGTRLSFDIGPMVTGNALTRSRALPCSDPSAYQPTLRLAAGSYTVGVSGALGGSLPISTRTATFGVFGPGPTPIGVDFAGFRVSGAVSVDGLPMGGCATTITGTSYTGVRLALVDTSNPTIRYELPVTCGAATTFDGWVAGGTYTWEIQRGGAPSALPMEPSNIWRGRQLTVSGTTTTSLALTSVPIDLTLLAGGLSPVSRCLGPTATEKLGVSFWYADAQLSYASLSVSIPCSSPSFGVVTRILEGRYHLRVSGRQTNLPLLQELGLFVPQPGMQPLVLDVPRAVTGSVVANGMPASCAPGDEMGMLRFIQPASTAYLRVLCGAQGALTFSGFVPRGRHRVELYATSDLETHGLPSWPTSVGVFDLQ